MAEFSVAEELSMQKICRIRRRIVDGRRQSATHSHSLIDKIINKLLSYQSSSKFHQSRFAEHI
jgi:hypothetical protein